MKDIERDELKASVLTASWLVAFGLGCALGNTLGLVIIAFSSALAGMYLKYDLERERKEKVREKVKEMFREEMKGVDNNEE